MADRMCSFCMELYTDEEGHNYDLCVQKCETALLKAMERVHVLEWALEGAKKVQSKDWWRRI